MQADPRVGTELAGHRIEEVIGRGGMAVVYLARHLRLGRKVALKVLDPALAQDDAFRERFIRESRVASGLDHPNIVTVYDAGEDDGVLYVSMRYVDGTNLERLVEAEGRLAPEVAIDIIAQSASALDAAHAQGLVHRGVRPADILLERGRSGTWRVFLSDFGITKHVAATTRLTRTGSFAGTVDYVAPELIQGEGDVDRRADVYSLGCVLFRCLVGEAPFPRDSELVTIFAHLQDAPPRPSELRPELPASMDAVIDRALAKSKEDRFATCLELAEAAARSAGIALPTDGPETEAGPSELVVPASGPTGRAKVLRYSGAVVAVVAVLLVGRAMLPGPSVTPGGGTPGGGTPTGSSGSPPPGVTGPNVIAAAGEIACGYVAADVDHCRDDDTARLIHPGKLAAVLALGDNQYETGAYSDYNAYYDRTWGEVKRITEPVPGDHEYAEDPTSQPTGYFRYFGSQVEGPNGFGYYSFDLPSGCTPQSGVCWHLVALNSELCLLPGGCGPAKSNSIAGPGNEMYRWLRHDLATHPNGRYPCTLAYWHHPRFSFSTGSATTPEVQPLWDLLYANHADVVLNSHSHNYQRWRPQDPQGLAAPKHGIREFIVGTGGARKDPLVSGTWPSNLEVAQATTFGILELSLRRMAYTWAWVSAAGQPAFSDRSTTPVGCT